MGARRVLSAAAIITAQPLPVSWAPSARSLCGECAFTNCCTIFPRFSQLSSSRVHLLLLIPSQTARGPFPDLKDPPPPSPITAVFLLQRFPSPNHASPNGALITGVASHIVLLGDSRLCLVLCARPGGRLVTKLCSLRFASYVILPRALRFHDTDYHTADSANVTDCTYTPRSAAASSFIHLLSNAAGGRG